VEACSKNLRALYWSEEGDPCDGRDHTIVSGGCLWLLFLLTLLVMMERTECSKMSAHKIQTLGNHLKERIQQVTVF
jgi:hypothetical protein